MERCQLYYDRPVHSLSEIKEKMNTKLKGDIFEHFALKYLTHVCGLSEVWLLKDLPNEHLDTLQLKRQDLGIDLVARDNKGEWYAIQAKYRKSNKYKLKNILGWKTLSTFQAMVTKSGPWKKHIVITNAHYVRHVGNGKGPKDKSICLGTLQNIKPHEWERMIGITGHALTEEPTSTPLPPPSEPLSPQFGALPFLSETLPPSSETLPPQLELQSESPSSGSPAPASRAGKIRFKTPLRSNRMDRPDQEELRRRRIAFFEHPDQDELRRRRLAFFEGSPSDNS
jgi:hypothetical protein